MNAAEAKTLVAEREELLDQIRSLLLRRLMIRLEADQIDPDVSLFGTGLALDSVDVVELVVSIEDELGARIPDGPEARIVLRTVNSLIDFVLAMRADAREGS